MTELVVVPQVQARRVTHLAMALRMTSEERAAIKVARNTDAQVDDAMALFDMAKWIDFDHPATQSGLALLVAKNLLTRERADSIVSAPIADAERP